MSTWSGDAPPLPSAGRRPQGHLWFLLLPIFTVGLASFVLPLWAAARTTSSKHGQARRDLPAEPPKPSVEVPRNVLFGLAVGLATASVLVILLDSLAPTDRSGTATGPLAALSTLLGISLLAAGVVLAVRWRGPLFPPVVSSRIAMLNASMVPPPVARAQARRSLRQQYQALALRDPALAREIGVGRPHLARDLDDGGLLDVNSVPAATLVDLADLTPEQAEEVIALRQQRHGLTTVDELIVFGRLPPTVVDRLREYAVFLPL